MSVKDSLSVIIPAFNEAERISPVLDSLHEFSNEDLLIEEIIIVNDGSTDKTLEVLKHFLDPRLKVVTLSKNIGKGGALKEGVAKAKSDFILLMDADGSTPITEANKLYSSLKLKNGDIAIGSRVLKDEKSVVKARLHRKILGSIFRTLVTQLKLGDFKDTQCGFKLFKCKIAKDLFSELTTNRFAFDLEILMRARAKEYSIIEVPISWTHHKGSKINLFWDCLEMGWQLLRLSFMEKTK